jgi:hypothetical protein
MCYLEPSIVFKAKVARHVRITFLTCLKKKKITFIPHMPKKNIDKLGVYTATDIV